MVDGLMLEVLQQYLKRRYLNRATKLGLSSLDDIQEYDRHSFYGDPVAQALLHSLTKRISDVTGLDLVPAHAFTSLYAPNSELKRHKDRPELQYTASLLVCTDDPEPWPIYVDMKDGSEPLELIAKPGDFLMFRGLDFPHWREKTNHNHIMIFFHFAERSQYEALGGAEHYESVYTYSRNEFMNDIELNIELSDIIDANNTHDKD